MAITFKFYADPGLTTELATGGDTIVQGVGQHDRVIYFGSTASGTTLQAASSPGTDPVTLTPTGTGTGVDATNIALSLSAIGLDSATPGDALTLGTSLASGAASAVEVYVRTLGAALAPGSYPGLSITTNAVVEA